jgi:hypothetical protein
MTSRRPSGRLDVSPPLVTRADARMTIGTLSNRRRQAPVGCGGAAQSSGLGRACVNRASSPSAHRTIMACGTHSSRGLEVGDPRKLSERHTRRQTFRSRRLRAFVLPGATGIARRGRRREEPLLGRDLKADEVREVMRMARRIAAILLLQPQLDANYLAVKGNTWEWGART